MKRYFALIFYLFLPLLIGAQVILTDFRFIPPMYFVGDTVELHIDIEMQSPLDISIPALLPQADWVDIRDIKIEDSENGQTIILEFVPFAAGTRSLPTIFLKDLKLEDIRISTSSMLQSSHEGMRRLRGQALLPGTRFGLTVFFAIIAIAPFIMYAFIRLMLRWLKWTAEMFHLRRPVWMMNRLIRKLYSNVNTIPASLWFSLLTNGLRAYLSERTALDCRSATTAEISVMKEFLDEDSPGIRLLEVLKNGDMVKFAGQQADDRSLLRTLLIVDATIRDWEKSHVQS